jgi:hypothetical protein
MGCLLAVAMFVVDIAAHTLISSSNIFSVRHETLYLLSFAAGLMSERAYLAVDSRAGIALGSFIRKGKNEASQTEEAGTIDSSEGAETEIIKADKIKSTETMG